jgi:DNA-binding HxlR family transcriptional regulator
VRRNPGYGHPLRPEYVLTARGAALGPRCARLWEAIERRDLTDVCLRKWSLAVLLTIAGGASRFSEIEAEVPNASPRAVTLAIKDLEAAGMIDRRVQKGYPPKAAHQITASGRSLIAPLRRFAQSLR